MVPSIRITYFELPHLVYKSFLSDALNLKILSMKFGKSRESCLETLSSMHAEPAIL